MHRCVFCRIRLAHQSNPHEGNHLHNGRSRLHKSSRIEKNSNPIRRAASTLMLVAGAFTAQRHRGEFRRRHDRSPLVVTAAAGPLRRFDPHEIEVRVPFSSDIQRPTLNPSPPKNRTSSPKRRTTVLRMSTFVDASQPGSFERTRDSPNSTSAGDMRQCKNKENLLIPIVLN
jgi:hypothetical protein